MKIPERIYKVPEASFIEVSEDFIRFDLSVIKYPPSKRVLNELKKHLERINAYPETNWSYLVRKIVEINGLQEKNILLTNGLDEAIDLITRTFVESGDKVLIPIPTFSQFEIAALRQNCNPLLINFLDDETYNFDEDTVIEIADKEHVKLLWICNPNNPTGTLIKRKKIVKVVEAVNFCPIVVDECYHEFCGESVIDLIDKHENLIVLRSFSKSYGLAGLRIGFIGADEGLIKALLRMRQPASVNLLAQIAALAALEDREHYSKILKKIEKEREKLIKRLNELGIKTFESKTNFVLLKTAKARKIFEGLEKRKISVFPGWDPEFSGLGENYLRITVGLPKENNYLIKSINEILSS